MASKRSWKTTLTGIFGLTMSAAAILHNPTIMLSPDAAPLMLTSIASSIGLILARDASTINKQMPTGDEIAAGADIAVKLKEIIAKRKAAN
jgi:hypothetical protein